MRSFIFVIANPRKQQIPVRLRFRAGSPLPLRLLLDSRLSLGVAQGPSRDDTVLSIALDSRHKGGWFAASPFLMDVKNKGVS
jgi:hypothetical protein